MDYCLFTLFHHNVENGHPSTFQYRTSSLIKRLNSKPSISIKDLSDVIYGIVEERINDINKDDDVSITLTGGMDSRVILACLLKAGIKPNCLTYGNPEAKDVYFARNLARHFNLEFQNVSHVKPTKEWYYKWVIETIKRDNGNSHLHRAHRTAAIAEHAQKYAPKILFTGHMGGEGIRGLTYNNYFASKFFEWVNEGQFTIEAAARKILEDYFLITDNLIFEQLINEIGKLRWMGENKQINKFYFLYDLVARIHHAQDIRLFNTYIPKVVPVYLQEQYLEILFKSDYHFLSKPKGFWGRFSNPYVHCKLIEYIYPKLLDFPLSNGFKPSEYLKGLWYYVPIKLYRNYQNQQKFPPTFSYGPWFQDFIEEHSRNVTSDIWKIYNKYRYFHALANNEHRKDEGYWHKFSNPIFFNLVAAHRKQLI